MNYIYSGYTDFLNYKCSKLNISTVLKNDNLINTYYDDALYNKDIVRIMYSYNSNIFYIDNSLNILSKYTQNDNSQNKLFYETANMQGFFDVSENYIYIDSADNNVINNNNNIFIIKCPFYPNSTLYGFITLLHFPLEYSNGILLQDYFGTNNISYKISIDLSNNYKFSYIYFSDASNNCLNAVYKFITNTDLSYSTTYSPYAVTFNMNSNNPKDISNVEFVVSNYNTNDNVNYYTYQFQYCSECQNNVDTYSTFNKYILCKHCKDVISFNYDINTNEKSFNYTMRFFQTENYDDFISYVKKCIFYMFNITIDSLDTIFPEYVYSYKQHSGVYIKNDIALSILFCQIPVDSFIKFIENTPFNDSGLKDLINNNKIGFSDMPIDIEITYTLIDGIITPVNYLFYGKF